MTIFATSVRLQLAEIRGISRLMDKALHSDAPASARTSRPQALISWLMGVAVLVFAMVVVGGITRLTESGLSITEWKPIFGAFSHELESK